MPLKTAARHMFGTIRQNFILGLISMLLFLTACSATKSVTPMPQKAMTLPAGWYLSLNNTDVKLMKAIEDKESYSIYFDRTNDEHDSKYFLKIAESIFPERARIITSAVNPSESWFFERLWWSEVYNKTLIPYALTGDTINYYIEQYQKVKSQIKANISQSTGKGSNRERVDFTYTAKVKDEGMVVIGSTTLPRKKVIMQMKWFEYSGQPGGWGFEKKREVVFAGKKMVLSITGDGVTSKWVSTERNPYGPDQWIRF